MAIYAAVILKDQQEVASCPPNSQQAACRLYLRQPMRVIFFQDEPHQKHNSKVPTFFHFDIKYSFKFSATYLQGTDSCQHLHPMFSLVLWSLLLLLSGGCHRDRCNAAHSAVKTPQRLVHSSENKYRKIRNKKT